LGNIELHQKGLVVVLQMLVEPVLALVQETSARLGHGGQPLYKINYKQFFLFLFLIFSLNFFLFFLYFFSFFVVFCLIHIIFHTVLQRDCYIPATTRRFPAGHGATHIVLNGRGHCVPRRIINKTNITNKIKSQ
jgi:hypothetical protein